MTFERRRLSGGMATQLLSGTWERVCQHSDHRLLHGLFSILLLGEVIMIVVIPFALIAVLTYFASMLLPESEAFRKTVLSNCLDYTFCLSVVLSFGVVLIIVMETSITILDYLRTYREP